MPDSATAATPLRILLIEDSEDDAVLLLRELRRGGYAPQSLRVDTADALCAALERDWDLVTCDWVMPKFSAPAALELLRQHGCELPVIIVSGEVGEEVAVSALKSGAHDYISKHRLTRLVPAVDRELREFADRQARRRAEAALGRAQERLQLFIDTATDLIFTLDDDARVTSVNAAVREVLGYEPDELIGRPGLDLLAPESRDIGRLGLEQVWRGEPIEHFEFETLTRDGQRRVLEIRGRAVHTLDGRIESFHIARDITERRRAEAERARLSAALEQSPEPIAVTDAEGALIYLNPAGERLTGLSSAEVRGRQYSPAAVGERRIWRGEDQVGRLLGC